LLHPFLLTLFRELGFREEDCWVSREAHQQAVLLLQYIATGRPELAEYELPLCKLLAGYPMGEPVAAELELTPVVEQEAAALLEHVIEQWPILGNTSPAGLRETFLARSGKLTRKDNGWLLQVEQKTVDLLLDHLPWGFGVVRNSWMEDVLFTEWI
jgi:hypothetical protein